MSYNELPSDDGACFDTESLSNEKAVKLSHVLRVLFDEKRTCYIAINDHFSEARVVRVFPHNNRDSVENAYAIFSHACVMAEDDMDRLVITGDLRELKKHFSVFTAKWTHHRGALNMFLRDLKSGDIKPPSTCEKLACLLESRGLKCMIDYDHPEWIRCEILLGILPILHPERDCALMEDVIQTQRDEIIRAFAVRFLRRQAGYTEEQVVKICGR